MKGKTFCYHADGLSIIQEIYRICACFYHALELGKLGGGVCIPRPH